MPFLAGLADNLNEISQISITGAGGEQLVGLQRTADEWTVSEAGGYRADRPKVNALLIALAEASMVEEKTSNPELHSRLGVEAVEGADAAGLGISLRNASGENFDLVLGDTYTGSQVYARVADSNRSVLIDRNPEVARDPGGWVVTDIVSIADDRIRRVEIVQADGATLVIRKEAPGDGNFIVDDIPEGRELQYAGVANVSANLLQNLRLDDVRPADEELSGPVVVSEFSAFDGLVVTVTATGAGDEAWLEFDASFDADAGTEADADTAGGDSVEADVAAEADAINQRLAGWQYRIPPYQLSQLTRRIEDLLKPRATE
jgi:hypothetical protein